MFGKPRGNSADDDQVPAPMQQFQRLSAMHAAAPGSPDEISSISSGIKIVGKIAGEGTVKVFGRIEGELHATTVVVSDGASVEGDLVADDLTVGGRVKGTIHANRVKLNSTAIVEGDIFHRSLAIEENARFEGSSRREDNTGDPTLRLKGSRSQAQAPAHAQAAAIEGGRKLNGPLDNEGPVKAAIE